MAILTSERNRQGPDSQEPHGHHMSCFSRFHGLKAPQASDQTAPEQAERSGRADEAVGPAEVPGSKASSVRLRHYLRQLVVAPIWPVLALASRSARVKETGPCSSGSGVSIAPSVPSPNYHPGLTKPKTSSTFTLQESTNFPPTSSSLPLIPPRTTNRPPTFPRRAGDYYGPQS